MKKEAPKKAKAQKEQPKAEQAAKAEEPKQEESQKGTVDMVTVAL